MKPATTENRITVDAITEGPVISFSHLSSYLISDDISNDHQSPAYGFPASQEENLYETGFLLKVFLKC